MAQFTSAYSAYDASGTTGVGLGNKDDLSDVIWDVSPTETPFVTAIRKTKAKAVTHEWMKDSLVAATGANAAIEGNEAAATAITPGTRLNNTCQILEKTIVVTGTQQAVDKVGTQDEVAYQTERRMKEIKRDLEKSMVGVAAVGLAKVTGDDSTARRMAQFENYITSNISVGSTGAAANGLGTNLLTAGTDRDLTQAILDAVLQTAYNNGSNASLMFVSAINKGVVSTFAGAGTRFTTVDAKKLSASIDVYEGDFHTLKVVPCRQLIGDNVIGIDPEYVANAELRPLTVSDLSKSGDTIKKLMNWETTVEVSNEAAHFVIADTNG
jgi:hypothetical protein